MFPTLGEMLSRLYIVPKGRKMVVTRFDQYSVALWWMAVKTLYGRLYPHLFKEPAGEGAEATRESQTEIMQAQLRMLTKGDVSKLDYVRNKVCTRDAMAELDAQAREAAEIKAKLKE